MKHVKLVVMVGLVMMFFVAGMALAQGGGQGKGAQGTLKLGCQERFDALDTNKDGQVTKEEFMATPHYRSDPDQTFESMDANGDGSLTKDEFCADKGRGQGKGQGAGYGRGQGAKP